MRTLPGSLLLALALAACGGGASKGGGTTPLDTTGDAPPAQPSPCATMATHVAAELKAAAGFDDAQAAVIERITAERCTKDAWSPEAVACYTKVDAKSDDTCDGMLTEAQNDAIEQQMQRELAPLIQKGDGATESAPPPAPPAPDDPCGGGA